MSEPTRRTRPSPTRTEPLRSWWPDTQEGAPRPEQAPDDPAPDAAPDAESPRQTAYDTVNNAYRLIDEYLRQGQRMAESLWLPSDGGPSEPKEAAYAPGRLLRAMGDMTMAWFEVLQQSTASPQSSRAEAPAGTAGPFSAGKTPPAASQQDSAKSAPRAAGALAISVQATTPVEVNVELTREVEPGKVIATDLRAPTASAGAISDITVDLAEFESSSRLKILVPAGHPPGTYNGLLLDAETQRPCGTVSVRVG